MHYQRVPEDEARVDLPPTNTWDTVRVLLILPLLGLFLAAITFIAAGPTFASFSNHAAAKADRPDTSFTYLSANGTTYTTCPSQNGTEDYITVYINVPQLTASKSSARVVVEFQLSDGLSGMMRNMVRLPLRNKLGIIFGSITQTFSDGALLSKLELDQTLAPSHPKSTHTFYPYDSYEADLYLIAYIEGVTGVRRPLPVCITLLSSLSLFNADHQHIPSVYPCRNDISPSPGRCSFVHTPVQFSRNGTTKFFSTFIVVMLWALSCMIAGTAIDYMALRPREPPATVIGFCITALFAIPQVRNVQPDVPFIGAGVDVIGFFWNMALVGLATLLLLSALVGYHIYPGHPPFKY